MGAGGRGTPAAEDAAEEEKVNFFVSYTRDDRRWAEWIAWQLEAQGYSTLVQAWDIRPGQRFIREMDRALIVAERTLAVLSHGYLRSPYTEMEWQEALRVDKHGTRRGLIPVRIDDVEPSGLLGQVVYIDLLGTDEHQAREKLLAGVDTTRAKPSRKPAFPGRPKPAFPNAGMSTAATPKTLTPATPTPTPRPATPTPTPTTPESGAAAPRLRPSAPQLASPAPRPTGRHIREIVTALGALDVILSPMSLAGVVRQLPPHVSARLPAQPGRLDVYLTDLVRACFEYPDGLTELLEVLDFYEHGTVTMDKLLDVVERITAELGTRSGGSANGLAGTPSGTGSEGQGGNYE
jgi:hypothetical protein